MKIFKNYYFILNLHLKINTYYVIIVIFDKLFRLNLREGRRGLLEVNCLDKQIL